MAGKHLASEGETLGDFRLPLLSACQRDFTARLLLHRVQSRHGQRTFQSRRTFSRWTARVLALCSRAPEHRGAFNLVSTRFMVVYGVWVCRLGGPYWSGLARWSPDVCPGLLSSGREAHARADCEHAAHLHPCAGIADRDSDATAILAVTGGS